MNIIEILKFFLELFHFTPCRTSCASSLAHHETVTDTNSIISLSTNIRYKHHSQLFTCTLILVGQVTVEAMEMVQAMYPSWTGLAAIANTYKMLSNTFLCS